ncbi:trafficking protein particle complex subunit 10-like isoform X2 [Portunus trituberculatus]|uniref:trafficking protein particle complex subunit 10-like isoform X2 n=1 Tax=Portunus trituberculatus TaxID=210409 RepID=UPI001E1CF448|nr:trafficking protein particle complex subunit 10-like isoform X2 [Portunus trituberculatus]
MNRRPIVTYAGDNSLFSGLQTGLVTGLPQESVEWRRSYGRPSRCVHVEVDFVPFFEECLVKETPRTILGQPIFHTYWTDCSDVEAYKNTTRDSLQSWALALKQHGITDWMVVLLETPDTRKGNKLLPRTTVLDKIKNDFGSKQPERCVSLVDPLKTDSRSLESWQTLLTKMRHLLMVAYNRALNRFEESMRAERERRTEKSWSFCWYFLLQEELAHVFQLLALYDEALVQYDELDALFTQFVVNSAAGDSPRWLSTFSQPCERWEGLHLTPELDTTVQAKIRSKEVTLLEFRNYLFQRQCALLMHLNKPWEVASRALTFLQNTVGELNILDVNVAPGGVACWGVLSCLEVTDALHRYHTTDAHALHTAPLWAYARDKLQELGVLCGLMPGSATSSTQLHTVISLVCGMGNDPHSHEEPPRESPMTRLKDSLSSPQAFKKHFLDLSEVAISTYKHIGRIRSARLIGRDLASFYMAQGEPQKAATFLTDQLTVFLEEGWQLLATQTQLQLAECYLATSDLERYVRTCAQLAGSRVLGNELRDTHFNKMMEAVEEVKEGLPVLIPSERILEVGSLNLVSEGRIILGAEVEVELSVLSKLPQDICCTSVHVSLHHWGDENESVSGRRIADSEAKNQQGGGKTQSAATPHSSGSSTVDTEHSTSSTSSSTSSSTTSSNSTSTSSSSSSSSSGPSENSEAEGNRMNPMIQSLPMTLHLEYKQDKSLSSASVTCPNSHKVLRRRDSQGGLYKVDRNIVKEEQKDSLSARDVIIRPGPNTIILHTKVEKKGKYSASQVVLALEQVEFVCGRWSVGGPPLTLEVVSESPRISLGKGSRDLLAGVTQEMVLTVHSGSCSISKGTVVKLRSSRGLTMRRQVKEEDEEKEGSLEREVEIQLSEVAPFSSVSSPLIVLAELGPQRDAATIEHMVSISSTLVEQRQDVDVHFIPPFMSSHKLHTANTSKFLQMTVTGLVGHPMELTQASLKVLDPHQEQQVQLKPLHHTSQTLVVCSDQAASYMWELEVDHQQEGTPVVKLEFSVMYQPQESPDGSGPNHPRIYTSTLDLHDYKTLYTIRARVEPSKGSELCRAGNMCHLHIVLQQVGPTSPPGNRAEPGTTTHQHSIMYEVLADQTMWAVCGRTAGVLTLEGAVRQSVTMDVMPLAGGFLPLPSVRLSKYIPADSKHSTSREGGRKMEHVGSASSVPRLQPFSPGQVYNFSKAQQVHVLPASNTLQADSLT